MSCRDDAVGTVWTQNLYTAKNTDYYVMSGAGEETYTPKLVCRGFRYVQISGVDEALPTEEVTGLVLSTKTRGQDILHALTSTSISCMRAFTGHS